MDVLREDLERGLVDQSLRRLVPSNRCGFPVKNMKKVEKVKLRESVRNNV